MSDLGAKSHLNLTVHECIFNYMRLEEHERVACAVYLLEKDGLSWWEITAQCEGTENISWDRFKTLLRAKYLGEANIDIKVREFIDLQQGRMTVPEYTAKFEELARFSAFIAPTDKAQKNKYMLGLRIDIARQIDIGKE